jgi:FG-GAP-like repeat/FG-GAP repeat
MKFARFVCPFILFVVATAFAQSNPVPFVNEPPVPLDAVQGGSSFTVTVNGTGFVSGSSINWNGTPLATTFVSSSQLTATVPASNIAKASTASITVSSPSPGGGISNVVFFAVSEPTTLQFTSFPSNSQETAFDQPSSDPLLAADFNRDGKLDFALIDEYPGENSQSVNTFLGNGDGSFQPPQATPSLSDWWAIGDFNGDGIPDLAGTYFVEDEQCYFSILLGNGNGTFRGGFQYIAGCSTFFPGQIAIGDFNGDGKLDVATPVTYPNGAGGAIFVFLGNGDGTFQNPLPSASGTWDNLGGVGDFNGDGKLDLIGVSGTQLIWLQGNGDGTFKTPITYYSVGANTERIIAADLNGDDKLDLITVQDAPTNTFTVMLGNGDGTFQPPVVYPEGTTLSGGVIGDFNADGKLDLVLSNSTDTLILPGNGDGTFQDSVEVGVVSAGAFDSVAGDFNNDGKLDLVGLVSGTYGSVPVYLLQEVPLPSLSPTSMTFADQGVGTTSLPQKVTLTNANTGTGPLLISNIAITGANSADFSQTNDCPASLAVGAGCQISVTFTPSALGVRNASLAITDNAPGSPQSTPLSGMGATPLAQLSPAGLQLGTLTVGAASSPQAVTLSNAGSLLTITSIGITGGDARDFAETSNCGSTLAGGGSCQIKVTFAPSASGARSAALTVSDDAPGSPQTVALSGIGQDFSLAPSGPASATVAPGQTATYTVVVTPGGGFNQTVDLSCSGEPAQSTCTVSSSVTLDGVNSSMATVSVVTTASAMGLTQPVNAPPFSGAVVLWLDVSGMLGLCLLAGLRGRDQTRRPELICGVAIFCFLAMGITVTACGGGGGGGSSGGGGTQAGTYSLTVTATSSAAKLTNRTNLTLVVQ